jgi:hypothetical protein
VEAITPVHALPRLPVARVLWKPEPDMETACAAWLLAGGAHHTVYSQNIKKETLQDFAENEAKYNHALAVRLHNAISLLPALRVKWGEDVVKYLFKHLYLFYKTKMIKKLDTSYNIKPANE